MVVVCVDNTPIMLQFLKENAEAAFPTQIYTHFSQKNLHLLM